MYWRAAGGDSTAAAPRDRPESQTIVCPTRACAAEEDLFFAGQPHQLYDHLTCTTALLRFTSSEGAGTHCQSGAQLLGFARIYDWLDDILTPGRRPTVASTNATG